MTSLRVLDPAAPVGLDAEQAILGALLLTGEAWPKCVDLLRPELFADQAHRTIFRVAHEMWAQGWGVDIVTLSARLHAQGLLDSVGGGYYISMLTNKVSSTAHLEFHARVLIQEFIGRRLVEIGQATAQGAMHSADIFSHLDSVRNEVNDLYSYLTNATLKSAATDIAMLTDGAPGKYYTFGIPDLDRKALFQCGLPHVFAGRPGIGKSVFALTVMWHLTLTGPVLLFSPEMTLKQVQARIVASECGVPYSAILSRRMNDQQILDVANASTRLADRLALLKVDDTSGITPEQVRARTERAVKDDGVIAFGLDHLHKMKTGDRRVDREETAKVSQCMEGLTEVAKSTNLPALVMCQLNREVEKRHDKKPMMADLKQTGKIEEDAAVVGLLYRAGYYEAQPPYSDTLEIIIAKNRDGDVGEATESMIPALSRIGGDHLHGLTPISTNPNKTTEPDGTPF